MIIACVKNNLKNEIAHDSLAVYAAACAASGILIDWRKNHVVSVRVTQVRKYMHISILRMYVYASGPEEAKSYWSGHSITTI